MNHPVAVARVGSVATLDQGSPAADGIADPRRRWTVRTVIDELGERAIRSLRMENEGPEHRRRWWISSAALLAELSLGPGDTAVTAPPAAAPAPA